MQLRGSTHFILTTTPSAKQTNADGIQARWDLCVIPDNTELNLKEIVLFIHACLGVDRDRSFFMEEK